MVSEDTLLIIPCCADKVPGGRSWSMYGQVTSDRGLADLLPGVQTVRGEVFAALRRDARYTTGKCAKNTRLKLGPDLGGTDLGGAYLPAVERYCGSLCRAVPRFAEVVRDVLG